MTTMTATPMTIRVLPRKPASVPYTEPYRKTGVIGIDACMKAAYLLRCTEIAYEAGVIHFTHQSRQNELSYVPGRTRTTEVFAVLCYTREH